MSEGEGRELLVSRAHARPNDMDSARNCTGAARMDSRRRRFAANRTPPAERRDLWGHGCPTRDAVRMELWLTNGTQETLAAWQCKTA